MGLFDLFKKTERSGSDATFNSEEITSEKFGNAAEETVETTLSYHPDWDVPQEQQYVFQFLSNELPPLKPNQISLSGIDLEKNVRTGQVAVSAFVRSSLQKAVKLDNAELLLLNEERQIVAAKEFDLSKLGDLPPKSDRPWTFQFEKESLKHDEIPSDNWTLAFNVQSLIPHQIEFHDSWQEALSNEQKHSLQQLVSKLPKLHKDEINLTGFQLKEQEEGSISVSVFIRNGKKQHITLEQIPLELLDAESKVVARGGFKLDKIEVRANSTKPWTFIFPKEMVQIESPNFSKWTVRVPQ